ncbi:MAG: fibronectin type III domain-containing protein, partial [Clostridiales bacterium]|nr:fibronectin type III domain-containing protein [Clostridiales bacterium]
MKKLKARFIAAGISACILFAYLPQKAPIIRADNEASVYQIWGNPEDQNDPGYVFSEEPVDGKEYLGEFISNGSYELDEYRGMLILNNAEVTAEYDYDHNQIILLGDSSITCENYIKATGRFASEAPAYEYEGEPDIGDLLEIVSNIHTEYDWDESAPGVELPNVYYDYVIIGNFDCTVNAGVLGIDPGAVYSIGPRPRFNENNQQDGWYPGITNVKRLVVQGSLILEGSSPNGDRTEMHVEELMNVLNGSVIGGRDARLIIESGVTVSGIDLYEPGDNGPVPRNNSDPIADPCFYTYVGDDESGFFWMIGQEGMDYRVPDDMFAVDYDEVWEWDESQDRDVQTGFVYIGDTLIRRNEQISFTKDQPITFTLEQPHTRNGETIHIEVDIQDYEYYSTDLPENDEHRIVLENNQFTITPTVSNGIQIRIAWSDFDDMRNGENEFMLNAVYNGDGKMGMIPAAHTHVLPQPGNDKCNRYSIPVSAVSATDGLKFTLSPDDGWYLSRMELTIDEYRIEYRETEDQPYIPSSKLLIRNDDGSYTLDLSTEANRIHENSWVDIHVDFSPYHGGWSGFRVEDNDRYYFSYSEDGENFFEFEKVQNDWGFIIPVEDYMNLQTLYIAVTPNDQNELVKGARVDFYGNSHDPEIGKYSCSILDETSYLFAIDMPEGGWTDYCEMRVRPFDPNVHDGVLNWHVEGNNFNNEVKVHGLADREWDLLEIDAGQQFSFTVEGSDDFYAVVLNYGWKEDILEAEDGVYSFDYDGQSEGLEVVVYMTEVEYEIRHMDFGRFEDETRIGIDIEFDGFLNGLPEGTFDFSETEGLIDVLTGYNRIAVILDNEATDLIFKINYPLDCEEFETWYMDTDITDYVVGNNYRCQIDLSHDDMDYYRLLSVKFRQPWKDGICFPGYEENSISVLYSIDGGEYEEPVWMTFDDRDDGEYRIPYSEFLTADEVTLRFCCEHLEEATGVKFCVERGEERYDSVLPITSLKNEEGFEGFYEVTLERPADGWFWRYGFELINWNDPIYDGFFQIGIKGRGDAQFKGISSPHWTPEEFVIGVPISFTVEGSYYNVCIRYNGRSLEELIPEEGVYTVVPQNNIGFEIVVYLSENDYLFDCMEWDWETQNQFEFPVWFEFFDELPEDVFAFDTDDGSIVDFRYTFDRARLIVTKDVSTVMIHVNLPDNLLDFGVFFKDMQITDEVLEDGYFEWDLKAENFAEPSFNFIKSDFTGIRIGFGEEAVFFVQYRLDDEETWHELDGDRLLTPDVYENAESITFKLIPGDDLTILAYGEQRSNGFRETRLTEDGCFTIERGSGWMNRDFYIVTWYDVFENEFVIRGLDEDIESTFIDRVISDYEVGQIYSCSEVEGGIIRFDLIDYNPDTDSVYLDIRGQQTIGPLEYNNGFTVDLNGMFIPAGLQIKIFTSVDDMHFDHLWAEDGEGCFDFDVFTSEEKLLPTSVDPVDGMVRITFENGYIEAPVASVILEDGNTFYKYVTSSNGITRLILALDGEGKAPIRIVPNEGYYYRVLTWDDGFEHDLTEEFADDGWVADYSWTQHYYRHIDFIPCEGPEPGWQEDDEGNVYFLSEDLTPVIGWYNIEGQWYFFNEEGILQNDPERFTMSASPKSGVTMTITWTSVEGASAYQLWYALDGSEYALFKKVGKQTSTSHTGLTAGTRYNYYIVALDANDKAIGVSQEVNAVALATPTLNEVVMVPEGLALAWSKASGADRYNIYRSETANGKFE